jgi:hypothetical protein
MPPAAHQAHGASPPRPDRIAVLAPEHIESVAGLDPLAMRVQPPRRRLLAMLGVIAVCLAALLAAAFLAPPLSIGTEAEDIIIDRAQHLIDERTDIAPLNLASHDGVPSDPVHGLLQRPAEGLATDVLDRSALPPMPATEGAADSSQTGQGASADDPSQAPLAPVPTGILLDEQFAGARSGWPSDPSGVARLDDGGYHLFARDPSRFVAVRAPTTDTPRHRAERKVPEGRRSGRRRLRNHRPRPGTGDARRHQSGRTLLRA